MLAVAKLAAVALAVRVGAKTIAVNVGQNGLAYSPNSISASVGDVLQFTFFPTNHSVVMGDFGNPCAPAATGGFFSGFMPVGSGEGAQIFSVTVNSTDPIVFYCAQTAGSHCQSGMAGVVNAAGGMTLAAYQSAAKSAGTSTAPPSAFGGALSANSATTTAASPAATTTTCGTGSGGSGGGSGYRRRSAQCNAAGDLKAPLAGLAAALGLGMLIMA